MTSYRLCVNSLQAAILSVVAVCLPVAAVPAEQYVNAQLPWHKPVLDQRGKLPGEPAIGLENHDLRVLHGDSPRSAMHRTCIRRSNRGRQTPSRSAALLLLPLARASAS